MKNPKVLTKQFVKSINELEEIIKEKSIEEKARDEYEKKMKETWRKVVEGKAHLKTYEKWETNYQLHKAKCTELSSLMGKAFYELRKKLEQASADEVKLEKCICTNGWILVLSDLVLIKQNYGTIGYIDEILQNMIFSDELAQSFRDEYFKHNTKAVKEFYLISRNRIIENC